MEVRDWPPPIHSLWARNWKRAMSGFCRTGLIVASSWSTFTPLTRVDVWVVIGRSPFLIYRIIDILNILSFPPKNLTPTLIRPEFPDQSENKMPGHLSQHEDVTVSLLEEQGSGYTQPLHDSTRFQLRHVPGCDIVRRAACVAESGDGV